MLISAKQFASDGLGTEDVTLDGGFFSLRSAVVLARDGWMDGVGFPAMPGTAV